MNILTDRERLKNVLTALQKNGYFAKGPFWDCSSCAGSNIPDEQNKLYVFWHLQDDDSAFGYRDLLNNSVLVYDDDLEDYIEHNYNAPIVYDDRADCVPEDTQKAFPNLVQSLYLRWGGDPEFIINLCRQEGFETEWSGSPDECIIILPPKTRKRN